MLYHKQLYNNDPENGVYGDCERTAIACILELELEEVPHFYKDNPSDKEFNIRVEEFLKTKGIYRVCFPFMGHIDCIYDFMKKTNKDVVYMLIGMSPRNYNHVVICKNDKIIHDPNESNLGIIGPCSDGHYWIEFLVPIKLSITDQTYKLRKKISHDQIEPDYELDNIISDNLKPLYKCGFEEK